MGLIVGSVLEIERLARGGVRKNDRKGETAPMRRDVILLPLLLALVL